MIDPFLLLVGACALSWGIGIGWAAIVVYAFLRRS